MVYKASNKIYDFRDFKTIRAYGNEIKNNVIDIDTANGEQNDLLKYIERFNRSTRPNNPLSKNLKEEVLNSATALISGRERVVKAIQSGIFPRSENSQQEGEGLKILTPNQMHKRLPIALAKIKAGND